MNGGHRWDLRSSLFVFYLKADLVHRERRYKVLRVIVHQVRTGGRSKILRDLVQKERRYKVLRVIVHQVRAAGRLKTLRDLVQMERRYKGLRDIVHQVRTGRRPVAVPVQSDYPLCAHTIPYA